MQKPTDPRPPATRSRRVLGGVSLAALSAITGIVSYNHGLLVVRSVGNTGLTAYLVPFVPDLMIVSSSLALIEASALRARRPVMAMLALVAGIGWTVAMNVAAGWPHGIGGALIAAGIPCSFVLTFESLLWLFRWAPSSPFTRNTDSPLGHCPHEPATDRDTAIRVAYEHSRDCLGDPVSQRALAARFQVNRNHVTAVVKTPPLEVFVNGDGPNEPAVTR